MNKFNNWLGDKLASGLSTMIAFYFISVLIILPLFWQQPQGIVGWIQYAISVFFQGAALPVLGYVARIAGEKQEQVLKETHDVVLEELAIVKDELVLAKEQRDELKIILDELKEHLFL